MYQLFIGLKRKFFLSSVRKHPPTALHRASENRFFSFAEYVRYNALRVRETFRLKREVSLTYLPLYRRICVYGKAYSTAKRSMVLL